jgi:hypothetical protein
MDGPGLDAKFDEYLRLYEQSQHRKTAPRAVKPQTLPLRSKATPLRDVSNHSPADRLADLSDSHHSKASQGPSVLTLDQLRAKYSSSRQPPRRNSASFHELAPRRPLLGRPAPAAAPAPGNATANLSGILSASISGTPSLRHPDPYHKHSDPSYTNPAHSNSTGCPDSDRVPRLGTPNFGGGQPTKPLHSEKRASRPSFKSN